MICRSLGTSNPRSHGTWPVINRSASTFARKPAAASRLRIGDWEGDLITGRSNRSAIATLVDRASRFVRLVHLPLDHGAEAVRDWLIAAFSGLPPAARPTLTWDQGSEMAYHNDIAPLLRDGVFFRSPW